MRRGAERGTADASQLALEVPVNVEDQGAIPTILPVIARAVVVNDHGGVDLEVGNACFAGVVRGRPFVALKQIVVVKLLVRLDRPCSVALEPPVVYVARVVELDQLGELDEETGLQGATLTPGVGFGVRVEVDAALELLTAPVTKVANEEQIKRIEATHAAGGADDLVFEWE